MSWEALLLLSLLLLYVNTCNCKLPTQLGTSAYPHDGVAHNLTHM